MLFKKLSVVGLLAVAAFGFTANAATADELQAQITALLAQISQLQGGSTSSIGCYAFTRDLTDGVSGADVSALQSYLASKGMFSVAPTGYFGPITRASVASWQSANGVMPAVGYFGAISRAKYAATCGAVVVNPPVTGDDDDDDTTNNGDLEGGAGSVDTYELISGLNNEEVGEDEEDVEVAGLEIEVDDGSDLQFTAVRLVFTESTGATPDFEDYASEVSIWLDGEEFGRADANDFSEDSSANTWTKTISLDDGAIIRAGETGELTVAVSGVSGLDTADSGDTWTVDFRQVRFEDADGALISEDPSTAVRSFTVETFADASNAELKVSLEDDEINDARVINVHATDDTDGVELLSFNLEAEGDSDLVIDEVPVLFTVTGAANVDDVVSDVTLFADGEEIGSENMTATAGATETITFTDLGYTLAAGETVEFVVEATFISLADALDAGDTISAQLSATEVDAIVAEDESGEDLGTADLTGTAVGDAHEARNIGMMVELNGTPTATITHEGDPAGTNDHDQGTFKIKFDVTAFDGDIYLDGTAPSEAGTAEHDLAIAGAETVLGSVITTTSGAVQSGVVNVDSRFLIEEGTTETFEISVTLAPTADGYFEVSMTDFIYALTDITGDVSYTFSLEDFKTPQLYLNFDA